MTSLRYLLFSIRKTNGQSYIIFPNTSMKWQVYQHSKLWCLLLWHHYVTIYSVTRLKRSYHRSCWEETWCFAPNSNNRMSAARNKVQPVFILPWEKINNPWGFGQRMILLCKSSKWSFLALSFQMPGTVFCRLETSVMALLVLATLQHCAFCKA